MTHIWKQIINAVRRHQYISITLPLPAGTATVSTIEGGPPWDVPILIQIVVDKPGIRWRQTFDNIGQAKEALSHERRRQTHRGAPGRDTGGGT